MKRTLAALLAALFCIPAVAIELTPFKTPDRIPDALVQLPPMQVQLEGYLGQRVAANEKARLLVVNEDELLGGYRKRPGSHPWIGEHVGKFLHAATLAWANTGDPQLKAKIDRVAAELMQCQMADGYLGTYLEKDRWISWDVWSHKYCMMGLLTYYQYTGNEQALTVCRRMGDLLINTFPAKLSIIQAGEHVGMAATSVLEPVVLLYRFSGDERYLAFAKYIVASWDEPKGPGVLKSLLTTKSVHKTANGKAYEMMSNLVGLCELARATGEQSYLTACVNAWEDVVAHQLYITGTASHGEHFGNDNDLPNQPKANVGETCVNTTWIQLSGQLMRLTGEARYGNELERTFYNHLAAAQLPDGSKWCYYTALWGTKPYGNSVNCCLSSGPRGMALAPTLAYFKSGDGIVINSLDSSRATARLGGQDVSIEMKSQFPRAGAAMITLQMAQPATFSLKLRVPAWAEPLSLKIDGDNNAVTAANGYAAIAARPWKNGDRIAVSFTLAPRLIVGDFGNKGLNALAWGPMVLAYDAALNPGLPQPAGLAMLEGIDGAALTVKPVAGDALAFDVAIRTAADAQPSRATFVPFAEAGVTGSKYQVWMSTTNRVISASLLSPGRESRSRQGNIDASIIDGLDDTVAVTFDNLPRAEDFFAVTLDTAVTIKRIVYLHGKSFHDGGWFDASGGKPRIQIQKEKKGAWEDLGVLADYPATTATSNAGLKDGQAITLKLTEPVKVFGVRIIGKPACGDNPKQAFTSCAELQAFGE